MMIRRAAAGFALFAGFSLPGFAAEQPPARPLHVKPERTAIFDLAATDGTLIAVCERGVILTSKDEGRSWTAIQTPTTRSLTSVVFVSARTAIAAGHGGTLMRSDDAGSTWHLVELPEIDRDSILGLLARKDGTVIAYGAFGMYLESADAGVTWKRLTVIREGFDRHISQVIEFGEKLFLVGESGTMAMSADNGSTWNEIKSPYQASFFGALALADNSLLAYGMRGHVFRSTDGGVKWEQVPLATTSALNGGFADDHGGVVLVGNAGLLAVSRDYGKSFVLSKAPEGLPLSRARFLKDGSILYVGYMSNGVRTAGDH